MRHLTSFILLCICLLSGLSVQAQQYSFRNFGVKDGLSGSTVNAIFQDSRGHIWFATQGSGASRYDGSVFRTFIRKDGLIGNDVICVAEAKDGAIWIGTSEGVSKFDGMGFTSFNGENGLDVGSGVYRILCADDGRVWMATKGAGVAIYDGEGFSVLGKEHGFPTTSAGNVNVYSIVQDLEGTVWLNCTNGVVSVRGESIIVHDHEAVKGKSFFSSHIDREGRVWFGGIPGRGVSTFFKGEFRKHPIPDELTNDFFGGITSDRQGNIWMATDHGLLKYADGRHTLFSGASGLSASTANCVMADHEDNIWVGLQGGGADLLRSEAFIHFTERDGLPNNHVSAIAPLPSGKGCVAATARHGIAVMDCVENGTQCDHTLLGNTAGLVVNSIATAGEGHFLIGTDNAILLFKKNESGLIRERTIRSVSGIGLKNVMGFSLGKDSALWVATYGSGLLRLSADDSTVFSKADGFPSDNILSVHGTDDDAVLVGTLDVGLLRLGADGWQPVGDADADEGLVVWSMDTDGMGNTWLGTWYRGLCRLRDGKVTCHGTEDGLRSANLSAVRWDAGGRCLWAGSAAGLQRISLADDGAIASIRTYTEHLRDRIFDINQNAIAIGADGSVWFGTGNGVSRYAQAGDQRQSSPPRLQLSAVRLAFQRVDWRTITDSVDAFTGIPVRPRLRHDRNHLVFDLSPLTQQEARFSYRMFGQDTLWSPWSRGTEANFSNIAPGTYTFEARAINGSGQVTAPDAHVRFTFTVQPPWWATWWARTGFAVLAAAGLVGFVKGRERVLREQNRKLEQTVTERTAEVVEQKHEVERQKAEVDKKHHALSESINYAQRLQEAVMPPQDALARLFPDSFLLFLPRDHVSGDFYWCDERDGIRYFAVGDCTGHGVPGAMLSIIGLNGLNRALNELHITQPADMLTQLTHDILTSFERAGKTVRDGMDLSICAVDMRNMTVTFSGANNPLWIARNGEILIHKANKRAVGHHEMEGEGFTQETIALMPGDTLYLASDGYQDQLGGPKGMKMMVKRFRGRLTELCDRPLPEQYGQLLIDLHDWMGTEGQTDDICVIGVRV
jgi:ligand-binding sensor domain-containing protein/serine phosphatase RsbU (regulator of sigma subunit)